VACQSPWQPRPTVRTPARRLWTQGSLKTHAFAWQQLSFFRHCQRGRCGARERQLRTANSSSRPRTVLGGATGNTNAHDDFCNSRRGPAGQGGRRNRPHASLVDPADARLLASGRNERGKDAATSIGMAACGRRRREHESRLEKTREAGKQGPRKRRPRRTVAPARSRGSAITKSNGRPDGIQVPVTHLKRAVPFPQTTQQPIGRLGGSSSPHVIGDGPPSATSKQSGPQCAPSSRIGPRHPSHGQTLLRRSNSGGRGRTVQPLTIAVRSA